jgi:hypothetical protein
MNDALNNNILHTKKGWNIYPIWKSEAVNQRRAGSTKVKIKRKK